jgi:hypothetical protein
MREEVVVWGSFISLSNTKSALSCVFEKKDLCGSHCTGILANSHHALSINIMVLP